MPIIIPVSRWKELCHQSIIYFGKCHSAPRSVAASDQVPMGKQCHQRTDNTTSLSLGRILSPMSIYFGKCHSSPRSLAASDQIPLGKQCHQRTDNNTSLTLGIIMSPKCNYFGKCLKSMSPRYIYLGKCHSAQKICVNTKTC